jgi:cytochrome P460
MSPRKITLALLSIISLTAFQFPDAGPAEDRVGLPAIAALTHIRTTAIEGDTKTLTIYTNASGAGVTAAGQRPYPYGSVFVAEWRNVLRDPAGAPLREGETLRTGPVFRIDVMRKGAGYGAAYGAARSGEWEYVSYAPDGSALTPAGRSGGCAGCHRNAGAERDFVFRGRF